MLKYVYRKNINCNIIYFRSRLSLDDENVISMASSLNLFICLVAKYFRQGDLAD